jgi:predicted nicotinamide N-methyase
MESSDPDFDESDVHADIGFMFDAYHAKTVKSFEFPNDIHVDIQLIGEDPGHVQSGQYLWPAAQFAARHIISHWELIKAPSVLELGAGCGLAGIIAGKMGGVKALVLTDYDFGSISLLRENCKLNNLLSNEHMVTKVCFLEWGNLESSSDCHPSCAEGSCEGVGFGLILGTDLLYCKEVVFPLLKSVSSLLERSIPGGLFILVSSFDVGEVGICRSVSPT